jgi:DNA-binding transcriptional regulator YdaS (Cro superfamily)
MPSHNDKLPLLRTVRAVVDLLGGTTATAARFKVKPPAVSIWLSRGRFPPARFLAIDAVVRDKKHRVDPSLFRESPRQKSETHAT